MTINLKMPEIKELKPKITVFGVGGAGGNAVNNMIRSGLEGCEFVVANTDSQALTSSRAERLIQMGVAVTEGLGAGSQPEVGRAAAEEAIDEITDHLDGSHMVFVTAGMGGGTGTGAAPIIARAARDQGILTVGVVTKPFQFEGARRMRVADQGIRDLQACVDTLIVIPNQNLFRIANEKTTFADAFAMADQVLYSGVACITDLMVKEGLINLDFADVRSVMREMGKAMMGTGEASGERRAIQAAEAAIANPLLDETSMKGAKGLLISITGGKDLTLFEVDEAATRIREEVDPDANIILGATFEESLEGVIRVSVVATGIDGEKREDVTPAETRMAELNQRLRTATQQPRARGGYPSGGKAGGGAAAAGRSAAACAAAGSRAAADARGHRPGDGGGGHLRPRARVEPGFRGDDRAARARSDPLCDRDRRRDGPRARHRAGAGGGAISSRRRPKCRRRTCRGSRISRRSSSARSSSAPLLRRRTRTAVRSAFSAALPMSASAAVRRKRRPRPSGPSRRRRPVPPSGRRQPPQAQRREAPPPPPDYGKRPPAPRAATPEGMYRPRAGDLDPHGRPLPQQRMSEDELEIPAFLRRQAN